MNELTALTAAYNSYLTAATAFERASNCGVHVESHTQLFAHQDSCERLAESIGAVVTKDYLHLDYVEYAFTYDGVKFVWLERIEQ